MSNFTDFNVFELIPCVSLRYVRSPAQLGNPDLIIIPGTKNTMSDLLWLRQNGLEAEIKKCAAGETVIFGICGGYQMLGRSLEDPYGVEQEECCQEWDCWISPQFLHPKKPGPR
jgi:adenosylcobyric acid synthase